MKMNNRKDYRVRRHLRLRHKVKGTAERPRMSVFVSNQHIYVQFIDDESSRTLASASTVASAELKGANLNVETAKKIGAIAAAAALEKGIKAVVYDRGGKAYQARQRALADAAREAGLQF
jgi:large subunit ribosomal protein L18